MSTKARLIGGYIAVFGLLAWPGSPAAQAEEDVRTLRVQGQGVGKDSAVRDALRRAVEQGGAQEIFSKSQTKEFALEYDVVLSRAAGIVKDFRILSESSAQGIVSVEIEAKVSRKLIDATWGEVAILLKQLGRPKIMVIFTEVIHDLERIEKNREVVQRSSILGTQIERRLLKLGFKLINPEQMKEIDRKKAEEAALKDDAGALCALAVSYGAPIYIRGVSRASGPQKTGYAGIELNMWETDVTIQGFWSETGEAIFSNTITGVRGGSRVAGPAGATQTMEKTGAKLADASVYDLLEAWTRGTSGGVGDIVVEVSDVADVKQSLDIRKALAAIPGVEEVGKEGAKGLVRYTVTTNLTAETLVEHMVDLHFAGFKLVVENHKSRTIVCKVQS